MSTPMSVVVVDPGVAAPAWIWPKSSLSRSVGTLMAKPGKDALAALDILT